MIVKSSAFKKGGKIPRKYSGDGENISPPINWEGVPEETESLVIIVEDPDAPNGVWVHWVVYDIPVTKSGFDEGVSHRDVFSDGTMQGQNGWGRVGYGGPQPPYGTHRYYFRLFALNAKLDIPSGISRNALLHAMQGHVIDQCEIMGTYTR